MNKNDLIFKYIAIVLKWKKILLLNVFSVGCIAAIVSLLLPKWYQAESIIVIPADTSMFGLSSLIGQIPLAGALGLPGMSSSYLTYLSILKSREIREEMIREFDLIKEFDVKNMDWALKDFDEYLKVDVTDEGAISVKYLDKDPNRSAVIINRLIELVQQRNIKIEVEQARNQRVFLEKRLNQNKQELRNAEDVLQLYQEKHGTIAIPEQVAATIQAIAQLKGQLLLDEIKLHSLSNSLKQDNPQIQTLKNNIDAINVQIKKIGKEKLHKSNDVFLAMADVPEVAAEYARLFRDLKVQETIFELITQQFELAKIQEMKDSPGIHVLDKARAPIRRKKPRRTLFVLFWAFLASIISFFYVVLVEKIYDYKKNDPELLQTITNKLHPWMRKLIDV